MAISNRNKPPQQSAAAAAFDVPPVREQAEACNHSNEQAPAAEETIGDVVRAELDSPSASNTVSLETPAAVVPPVPARQGDEGRPYCPVHQCLMRANGTREQVTTYACPVPTCKCSEKRARPTVRIARDPVACPNRTCASPQQFLEFDPKRSTFSQLHLECPACHFSIKQPRPQFNAMQELKRRRPPREELSDR